MRALTVESLAPRGRSRCLIGPSMTCTGNTGSWVGMTQAEVAKELSDVAVRKLFPKFGWFDGKVKSFENGMFTVHFDDGDEESMDLKTLAPCLPQHECMKVKEFLGLPAGRPSAGKAKGVGDADGSRQGKQKRATSPDSDSEVEVIQSEKKAPEVIQISDSEMSDEESSDADVDYDSDESEWEEAGSSTNGKAKIKVGKVTVEAFCVDVDEDSPGGRGSEKDKLAEETEAGAANEEVRNKIRKMLKLGLHPDTPDAEAQQALKNANRFLTRYNLQQVDILKEGEDEDKQGTLAGGMKVVKLRSKSAGRTTVNNAAWISSLGSLVSNCFDCCYYTQHRRDGMHYVFYGVVTNAECAGYAFAAAFNRITVMTANYCGDDRKAGYGGGYWGSPWGGGSSASETVTMRANYRDGLVEGLRKAVVEEKKERKRKAAEREQRRKAAAEAKREAKLAKARAEAAALAELDDDAPLIGAAAGKPLAAAPGTGAEAGATDGAGGGEDSGSDAYEESAESGEDDDGMGIKWRAKAEKQQQCNQSQALVVLEHHCHKVAEKVLEDNKIKLRKGAALRGTSNFDPEAYRKGQEDAKLIDIKQRGIADKPASKKRRS